MKSIMQNPDEEVCFFCGRYAVRPYGAVHHALHGTANRKLADKDGLTVRLCHRCHMNLHDKGNLDKELQRIAQARWMEYYGKSEDEFRERYGKSYI